MSYFRKIADDRANSLLLSEDTFAFYQYNLSIIPSELIANALIYIL